MNAPVADNDRLWVLVDAVCVGTASEEDRRELDVCLSNDADARSLYISYCQLHTTLGLVHRGERAGLMVREAIREELAATSSHGYDAPTASHDADSSAVRGPDLPFILIGPDDATCPRSGFFAQGVPLAYGIATVLFAIGLTIGAFTYVSHPTHVAQRSRSLPSPLPSPLPCVVGRITGMVDCRFAATKGLGIRDWGLEEERGDGVASGQWPVASSRIPSPQSLAPSPSSNPQSLIPNPSAVASGQWPVASERQRLGGRDRGFEADTNKPSPLSSLPSPLIHVGDRFEIVSGLLEITYDTGARVILQGPVRYEVDSAAGGCLTAGKLTAKLGKSGEWRVESGEKLASPESLAPSPFVVTTPTRWSSRISARSLASRYSREDWSEFMSFRANVKAEYTGQPGGSRAIGTVYVKQGQSPSVELAGRAGRSHRRLRAEIIRAVVGKHAGRRRRFIAASAVLG